MSINIDDITKMTVEEGIKFLDEKRRIADIKSEEIINMRSAIESPTIKIDMYYEIEEKCKDIEEEIDSNDFEKEIDYYMSEFIHLKEYTKESIEEVLPTPNNYNYARIISRIIAELIHEIKDIKEIIITDSSNMSKEDLKEYKDEISSSYDKVRILKEILLKKDDEEIYEEKRNKLIFVPIKDSGKIRVLEEVDDIPQEEYEGFLELYESIKDGTFKNIRRFVNNENLNGAFEVKGHQIRVVFRRISKDCYAIITMFVKKQQNADVYRQAIAQKYSEYKDIEKCLKEKIKDPVFMRQQEEYEKELYKKLSNSKVGGK